MRLFTAIALAFVCLFSLPASAATVPATPATLAAVQKAAKAGDVISLAPVPGYGQLMLRNAAFSPPLTFQSADPVLRPTFDSVYLSGATGVTLKNLAVSRPATTTLTSGNNAVAILTSHFIELDNVSVYGAPSITGIPADSDASSVSRVGEAVLGWPNGRGVYIYGSDHVAVNGCEVSSFLKGVTLSGVADVSVSNCDIHDIRTSSIDGGGLTRVTIADDFLHHFKPWRGSGVKASDADHADTLHFFTKNSTAPDDSVTITGNTIVDDTGSGILGINLEGTSAGGYTNCVVTGNTEILDNTQAFTANWLKSCLVAHNAFLPTTSVDDPKHIPGIILQNPAPPPSLVIAGNVIGKTTNDVAPYGPNTFLAASFVAAHLTGASATLAPVGVASVSTGPDPRDAQITALTGQLATAQAVAVKAAADRDAAQVSAAAANDNLAAANANLVTAKASADATGQRLAAVLTGLQSLAASASAPN